MGRRELRRLSGETLRSDCAKGQVAVYVDVRVRVPMRSHESLIADTGPPVVRGLSGFVLKFARICLASIPGKIRVSQSTGQKHLGHADLRVLSKIHEDH